MNSLGKTITNPNGRIICVGDPHGCANEVIELLDKCKVTEKDTVIFVGDLVDRGPDSARCVDIAMKHECILGNHEETHLRYEDAAVQFGVQHLPVTMPWHHQETRSQLQRHHFDYLRALPLYIKLPEHNAVVVHAGVFPGVPIDAQAPKHLLHIQMVYPERLPDGTINKASKWPSKAPPEYKFWTKYWQGPERIIFGHTVLTEPLMTEHVAGIDGGGCFGRELWALVLPGWEIVKVKSKTEFGRPAGEGRGREPGRIKQYPVHGLVSAFS